MVLIFKMHKDTFKRKIKYLADSFYFKMYILRMANGSEE